jgi:hypothetical protein
MAALSHDERMAALTLAELYPHCVTKAEKKGHSERALLEAITWLPGLSKADIDRHLGAESTFEDVFAEAELNPNASLITGVICGVRVEEIENLLTQRVRYLDKLVDELAKGKAMEKILRA